MKRICKLPALRALSLACLLNLAPAAWAALAGQVQFVSGDVQISGPAGPARLLKKGDAVNEGDTVSCAASASAQIKMQDGGFVAVRPDTALKFDQFVFSGQQDGQERSVFSLIKGGFRAVTGLIGQVNKKNYRIHTPVATIGIRGTDHETVLVLPGSAMALLAPSGAYSKVNLGETTLTTDKGSVNVLPNQMGFAAGLNQAPQVQPLNTRVFTVAPAPGITAKVDKKEEKKDPAGHSGGGAVASAEATPTATSAPQDASGPIRATAATDSLAPVVSLAPATPAPAAEVLALPGPSTQFVVAPVVDPQGSTLNLTTGTATTPGGQVIPINQSQIALQARDAASLAGTAALAADAAAKAAAARSASLAGIVPPGTAGASAAIGAAATGIGSAGTAVTAASSLGLAGSVAQATASAGSAQTLAAGAAAQAAAAQAALTANGLFADKTAAPANAAVQNASGSMQTANTAVQSAAGTVSLQNTALLSAQGTAAGAMQAANNHLTAANTSLTNAMSNNTLLAVIQGTGATQAAAAQAALTSARGAAAVAATAAIEAAERQAAGDLASAQTQLLIARQQLGVAQTAQDAALAAQTALATQLAEASAAAAAAASATTAATTEATSAAANALAANAQAAAAQAASTSATAALQALSTNLAAIQNQATVLASNAPVAAYNNPAVSANFISATMFPVATSGGFNEAFAPSKLAQPNDRYVLDGSGNLVEARSALFVLQTNQNGTLLQPSITATAGADIRWTGGTAADTFKLADNSLYMGRWSGATVTVVDNSTATNVFSYTPATSLWAVLLPPSIGYVTGLIGTSSYSKVGNTVPVDAFGTLGTLNTATLSANFTTQTADATVNLTMGSGPMSGTFNVSASAMPIDPTGGFGGSGAGRLASSCSGSARDCAATSGYSADLGGSFSGSAAAGAGMSYKIWPTVASAAPASDSIQGLVAFTAPAPVVNLAGPLTAYSPTGLAVAYTGASGGGFNFIASPGDVTPSAAPTTFTENYGSGSGFRTDVLNLVNPTSLPVMTTTSNGITLGTWDKLSSVSSTEQHLLVPNRQGSGSMLPIYMYGEQGYVDAPLVGVFDYLQAAQLSVDKNSWAKGSLSKAALTANFTSQTVSLSLAGALGGNYWTSDSASLPINLMIGNNPPNASNGAGARFYDSAPTIKLASSPVSVDTPVCLSCNGNVNGAFIGQNYAGAIVQYSLWDSAPASSLNVAGLVAFDRTYPNNNNPVVTNAKAAPTGATVVASSWQIQDSTQPVSVDTNRVLSQWGGSGWSSSVTPAVGSVALAAVGTGSGTINWGEWGAGSMAASAFTSLPAGGQLHWITAPEPTPVYLAQVLTTKVDYSLLQGNVTSSAPGITAVMPGSVGSKTSLTANFASQTVAVNLDAVVNQRNWLASANSVPLQYLNGNSQTGFYADSYGLSSKPGYLNVTVDGVAASGSLAGQLAGAALEGAILKFNLTGPLASGQTPPLLNGVTATTSPAFETVQGVVALGATSANDPATPYRMVLTSITDPKATLPSVMVGGSYNNAARVLTDPAGSLTGFDFSSGGGGSGSTLRVANAGTGNGFIDQGSAMIAGATVSWGRWDAGTVLTVTDRATATAQNVTLTGGAHMVAGPLMTGPVTLPSAGTYAYSKVGNTLPTDNMGVAGLLNSASLSANFSAQTVDVAVNVTAAGATLDALAKGVPIQQRANFFADSKMTGPTALVVTCQSGACGDANHGALGGGFGGPGGLAAAITYGFEKTGANAATVSGVAVFKR